MIAIPNTTRAVLDALETTREPTVDYEVASKLAGLNHAEGLTDAERKGAWAEASAFLFRPTKESPWGTHYGPNFSATKDGAPVYAPDIAEIDEEIITHWEHRSETAQHPVLRARYADMVWDFKKRVTNHQPKVEYAQRAIDGFIDGVNANLFKGPTKTEPVSRALALAISINDQPRVQKCKNLMLELFGDGTERLQTGVRTTIFDNLTESKRSGLAPEETERLIQGLENELRICVTPGDHFDPHEAEAAARRLASYYERTGRKDDVQRVIRAYGSAFEYLAAQAGPLWAMSWLQPIHDEYKNRGMNEDAARVQAASAEKGKDVKSDLREISMPLEITEEQLQQLAADLAKGPPREAIMRIARDLIPQTGKIKTLLQELLTKAPLMARIGITRIVSDHFAAQAGSIEDDPEGRLIMQLASHIDIYNLFLNRAFEHLRSTNELTAEALLAVLDESPVFAGERRPLLAEGIEAYLTGDHTKAIHVVVPQIEQALRELLTLIGVPVLKPGRNGMMQLKNLNDILREPAIKKALGEDLRLYLLTFLADQRGQNIRNVICHGLATPAQFNQRLADQTIHALLAISLVRKDTPDPLPE